jgi:hypothetical protein
MLEAFTRINVCAGRPIQSHIPENTEEKSACPMIDILDRAPLHSASTCSRSSAASHIVSTGEMWFNQSIRPVFP